MFENEEIKTFKFVHLEDSFIQKQLEILVL